MNTQAHALKYHGQFVLTNQTARVRHGAEVRESHGWLLATFDLPVLDVFSTDRKLIGWCLGFPVTKTMPSQLVLDTVDRFYETVSGRFALFLFNDSFYLDAYGSLAAVYSVEEQTIASTPSLLCPSLDAELAAAIGFPERDVWLPSGLTLSPGIRRLQANHRLDIHRWVAVRHWMPPVVESSVDVRGVVDAVRGTVAGIASVYKPTFGLTAGRDSRMLLACARPYLESADFFTVSLPGNEVDSDIACRIAAAHSLAHRLLPIEHATESERIEWLARTGQAVAGAILDLHPTLRHMYPAKPLLHGIAGEVGRGFYWARFARSRSQIGATSLLKCLRLPDHPQFVNATAAWLSPVSSFPVRTILDLAYIEQRLSCWAAPQHYGNHWSLFEVAPIASRASFTAMLKLPYEFRADQMMFENVCRREWPELLRWPIYSFAGPRGVAHRVARRSTTILKQAVKRVIRPEL